MVAFHFSDPHFAIFVPLLVVLFPVELKAPLEERPQVPTAEIELVASPFFIAQGEHSDNLNEHYKWPTVVSRGEKCQHARLPHWLNRALAR